MSEASILERDSRDQNDDTRKPAETNGDEDRNTSEDTESGAEEKEKAASESTATSVFHNLNVFRDFFLAAFSDGYNVCNPNKIGKSSPRIQSWF